MSDILHWIEDFYGSFCNGDWEHSYGIEVNSMDNPGWSLHFDLYEVKFDTDKIELVDISEENENWLKVIIEDEKYISYCSPKMLTEMLEKFRQNMIAANARPYEESEYDDNPWPEVPK